MGALSALSGAPFGSSVLAFATTLHLSLALVCQHRRQGSSALSPLALVSFAFIALPWVFATPAGVGAGLAVHMAWCAACERLLAPFATRAAIRSGTAPAAATAASGPVRSLPQTIGPGQAGSAVDAQRPRPNGFVQAPVLAIFDEAADIRTFRILRPEGFSFEAGQFLPVRIRVDGQEYVRCYSISSAPHASGYLEISVKSQGVVSSALHATARPGGMLAVKAPAGAFRYPAADDRPILLLAGGIGITPLLSMLRHAAATEPTRPVTLIYSVHDETAFAFREELGAIARRHPLVRIFFAASAGATHPHIYRGRIDEPLLKTVAPELRHAIAFICGPTPMIDGMRALLGKLGVPPSQIRFELFEAAVAAAARADAPDTAHAAVRTAPGAGASCDMLCARSGTRVAVRPGQSLLDAAEGAGLAVDSLCRAGVCGTCRVQVTAGDVRCDSTMLGDDERRAGYVFACVATPHGDCTVQL